jgi:hypothetical protein
MRYVFASCPGALATGPAGAKGFSITTDLGSGIPAGCADRRGTFDIGLPDSHYSETAILSTIEALVHRWL